ncbi:hypothetical protein DFH28DRAFT_1063 [Melampsora americana]|nr:hypothetical protein DFH28DRAFT_1063 [Melampsora americana]
MQNPFEEQQTILLSRMIGNIEKLSEAMEELNNSLEEITKYNSKVFEFHQALEHYNLNVKYNLENQPVEND